MMQVIFMGQSGEGVGGFDVRRCHAAADAHQHLDRICLFAPAVVLDIDAVGVVGCLDDETVVLNPDLRQSFGWDR